MSNSSKNAITTTTPAPITNDFTTFPSLPCGCRTHPRPALEHPNLGCPVRLSFYGAPPEWGVGRPGEVRWAMRFYVWNSGQLTWSPLYISAKYVE